MKNFNEEIENYEYTSFSDKDKLYFRKVGYEPKDIIAIMDFKNNVFRTENNTYSLDEFSPEFVDHFRVFASVENRDLNKLPLTQEVLDISDYILDEEYISEYERPKKEKYNASVEQMKLAFHYEMTILARLEDRLEISKDELLHEIGPIGMRAGVEETEKVIIEEHGKPEEKANVRDESIIASVTKEVVDVSTKSVNEISEELIDEPIFEEPEFGEEIFDPEMENFEEDFMEQLY